MRAIEQYREANSTLSRLLLLPYLAMLVVLGSCGAAGADTPRAVPRIVDGTPVQESQFATVGRLVDQSGQTQCTGTLIGPDAVLLAGHCVTFDDTGTKDPVVLNWTVRFDGNDYGIAEVITHPTWDGRINVEGVFDIALIRLSRPVTLPAGVSPTKLFTGQPTVGMQITLVGFGNQGTGLTGVNYTYPQQGTVNVGKTTIDEVTATFIRWTFEDRPPPDKESTSADGDSGGPNFIVSNGIQYIAGVTHAGEPPSDFETISTKVRVDPVVPWIKNLPWRMDALPGLSSIHAGEQVLVIARNTNAIGEVTVLPGATWTVTGGGTIDPAGIFTATTAGGPFTVTATLADGRTLTAPIIVLPNSPPTILSGITTSPSVGVTGSPVWFSASGQDPDGQPLTYRWDFGDGFSGIGQAPAHVYSQPGTYAVVLTVSDGLASVTNGVALSVQAPAGKVWVKRMLARVNFSGTGKDELRITGGFSPGPGEGFDPNGAVVTLNVGGVQETFTLDTQGKGSAGSGFLYVAPGRGFKTFTARLTGSFAATWTDDGLTDQTVKRQSVELPVLVIICADAFTGTAGLLYSATTGVKGMAR